MLKRFFDRLFDPMAEKIARRAVDYLYSREMHPNTLLLRECQKEAAAFVKETMPDALSFPERLELLRFAVDRISVTGLVLEFGVFQGKSIHVIAEAAGREVHGFDSFEGLPEDWWGNTHRKGEFSTHGKLPEVPPNVTLHKGWFEDTLPVFMREHAEPLAFAHVDCDLYRSAKIVLDNLQDRLQEGTVVVFDDFFNFPGWKEHEYRAFQELVAATALEYRFLGYARNQVALVVTATPRGSLAATTPGGA